MNAILPALTRYSANDPQFPVNDRSLSTGKSHVDGGAPRPNGPADEEYYRRVGGFPFKPLINSSPLAMTMMNVLTTQSHAWPTTQDSQSPTRLMARG